MATVKLFWKKKMLKLIRKIPIGMLGTKLYRVPEVRIVPYKDKAKDNN